MKKRLYGILIACLLVLSMTVSVFAEAVEQFGTYDKSAFEASSSNFLEQCFQIMEAGEDQASAYAEYYEEAGQSAIAEGLTQFQELYSEMGAFVEDESFIMEDPGDESLHTVLTFKTENGEYELTIDYDENLNLTLVSVQPAGGASGGSLGAKMKTAALNTLLGMGTVFVVLIFISFLISLFKFIPRIQEKMSGKKTEPEELETLTVRTADTPVTEPVDDTELVAVIAAAVAASMGSEKTDGFVVRSIRKRS